MITTISIQFSLTVVIITGLFFVVLGYLNSKKTISNQDYIVGNRDENTFTLTASLTASALGAWILFGPASAATWGGVGAVTGYALGTAVPKAYPVTAPTPPQVAADAGPNKIQAPRADAVKLAVNVKVFSSLFPTI